jgi:hypothetical protein
MVDFRVHSGLLCIAKSHGVNGVDRGNGYTKVVILRKLRGYRRSLTTSYHALASSYVIENTAKPCFLVVGTWYYSV